MVAFFDYPVVGTDWTPTTATSTDTTTHSDYYTGPWWSCDTNRGSVSSSSSGQTVCSVSSGPQFPNPKKLTWKEYLEQLPKFSMKRPRLDLEAMSRAISRKRAMAAVLSMSVPKFDNSKKYKKFFNQNAVVRVFCQN